LPEPTPPACSSSMARLASTSLAFMLWLVPAPAWNGSMRKLSISSRLLGGPGGREGRPSWDRRVASARSSPFRQRGRRRFGVGRAEDLVGCLDDRVAELLGQAAGGHVGARRGLLDLDDGPDEGRVRPGPGDRESCGCRARSGRRSRRRREPRGSPADPSRSGTRGVASGEWREWREWRGSSWSAPRSSCCRRCEAGAGVARFYRRQPPRRQRRSGFVAGAARDPDRRPAGRQKVGAARDPAPSSKPIPCPLPQSRIFPPRAA
jgi:hypothetical protein